MSKKYPDYFPEGCPPVDACCTKYKVFRAVQSNDELSVEDFYPVYLERPKKQNKYKNNPLAFGVSVFEDISDLKTAMTITPALRDKTGIATGITYEYTGVTKRTPKNYKSHITWWLYDSIQPITFFTMI